MSIVLDDESACFWAETILFLSLAIGKLLTILAVIFSLVNELVGNEIPMNKPNMIPQHMETISLIVSADIKELEPRPRFLMLNTVSEWISTTKLVK